MCAPICDVTQPFWHLFDSLVHTDCTRNGDCRQTSFGVMACSGPPQRSVCQRDVSASLGRSPPSPCNAVPDRRGVRFRLPHDWLASHHSVNWSTYISKICARSARLLCGRKRHRSKMRKRRLGSYNMAALIPSELSGLSSRARLGIRFPPASGARRAEPASGDEHRRTSPDHIERDRKDQACESDRQHAFPG